MTWVCPPASVGVWLFAAVVVGLALLMLAVLGLIYAYQAWQAQDEDGGLDAVWASLPDEIRGDWDLWEREMGGLR